MVLSSEALLGVFEALFTMYFFAAMGWLFHKFGYLDHLSDLAQICFTYFLPCYSFVAVSRALDWESFQTNWTLFLIGPFHIALGFCVGWLLLYPFSMPSYQKRLLQMSIACTNVGEVVVTLVDVLGRTELLAGDDLAEAGEGRAERGIGLIQVYMTAWSFVVWTIVWSYVQVPAELQEKGLADDLLADDRSKAAEQLDRTSALGVMSSPSGPLSANGEHRMSNVASNRSDATRGILSVKLNKVNNLGGVDTSSQCDQNLEILKNVAKSPIIIACVLGLVVALIPALRGLFFSDTNRAPLGFLFRLFEGIGRGYLPGVWLVVGAELRQGFEIQSAAMQTQGQSFWQAVDKTMVGVVVARLIVVPLINFLVIYLLISGGVLSAEPMFAFVALATPIGPTSSTFQLIMEVLHAPHGRYVSFTILLQFACALVILPFTTFGCLLVMDASG